MKRSVLIFLLLTTLTAVAQTPGTATIGTAIDPVIAPSVPTADLRILKRFTAKGAGGAFTLTVTNFGPNTALPAIVIQDVLPAGVAFTGGSSGCSASGSTVTCTRNTPLSVGASYSETINVNVTATTALVNCATVRGKLPDPNDRNNRACACITPSTPCQALRIDVSTGADNGAALAVGASDNDWIVTAVPAGATGAGAAAIVPQKPVPWLAPGPTAAWITARPASGTTPQIRAGDYTYEFTFQLPPDLDGGKCVLAARYAVDNLVTLTLGNPIGSWQTFTSAAFTALHATTPATVSFAATPGPHKLRAVVHNGTATTTSGNEAVTGFLLTGTITCECAKP